MKTITFALQKGGTGKTSTSVSIAVELAHLQKKVLLVDADPQGNATTWLNAFTVNYELADILNDKIETEKAIIKTNIENLFLLPTAGINGELKTYCDNNVRLLKFEKSLKSIQDNFDYCIIDTSPAFGNFERSIFRATDEVIPVLKLDEFSKDGLQIFIHRLLDCIKNDMDESKEIEFSKIVFTSKDDRISQHAELLKDFDSWKSKMKFYLIPIDQTFPKSQKKHKPLQEIGAKKSTLEIISVLAKDL